MATKVEEASVKTEGTAVPGTTAAPTPKPKKLSKAIAANVITITEGVTKKVLSFDINSLNDAIRFNLSMHGLSQKLGDAAAGKVGEEAITAIGVVWDGLSKGDWTVRAPAGQKISKATITEKLSGLSPKEQETAKALLAKLGLTL